MIELPFLNRLCWMQGILVWSGHVLEPVPGLDGLIFRVREWFAASPPAASRTFVHAFQVSVRLERSSLNEPVRKGRTCVPGIRGQRKRASGDQTLNPKLKP